MNDRTSPSQSETRGDGGSEFRVIQTNPRFYKNPFKRPDGSLAGGREGAVDLDKLFPEECLINEDCPDTDYCDPNTRSCTDACNLDGNHQLKIWFDNRTSITCARHQPEVSSYLYTVIFPSIAVCGGAALCRSALNRPVCYCPDGFEGNPYDECKKVRKNERTKEKLNYPPRDKLSPPVDNVALIHACPLSSFQSPSRVGMRFKRGLISLP